MISPAAIDYLRLNLVHGVGVVTAQQLIEHFGSAAEIWQQPPQSWSGFSGVSVKLASALRQACHHQDQAEEIVQYCESVGIHLICSEDEAWPEGLRGCSDAPLILYARGQLNCLKSEKILAVVGARKASAEGKLITRRWSSFCSKQGVTVISGMAPGIDSAAHGGSLDAESAGIAVLGYGLEAGSFQQLQQIEALAEKGCVISEYAPKMVARAGYFPQRNRLIAGIAQALLVVEGGLKSGSLITARQALNYGREVFAVPGSVLNGMHAGCHQLLKDGAMLATRAEDILQNLHWSTVIKRSATYEPSSDQEAKIFKALAREILHIDSLAQDCSLTVPDLSTILLRLELEGIIEKLPGSRYTLS